MEMGFLADDLDCRLGCSCLNIRKIGDLLHCGFTGNVLGRMETKRAERIYLGDGYCVICPMML